MTRPEADSTGMLPTTRRSNVPSAVPTAGRWGILGRLAGRLDRSLATLQARQPGADRQMLAAIMVAAVLFAVFPAANFLSGRFAMDYDLWYFTAENFLHHRPIYPADTQLSFIYPPSAAAMLASLAALGRPAFILVPLALNTVSWIASAALTVWLVTGATRRQHPLLVLLPSLAMAFWIWDTYLLGQPSLGLLALMLAAFACLRRRRPALAGALIATATAIKAYPALAIVYLVYRRHWKATFATLVSLAGWLLVVPLAFRSPATAVKELATWSRKVVMTYDDSGMSERGVRAFSYRNQSVMGVANRLLRPVPADGEADVGWKVNVASLGFDTVNAVIVIIMLALAAFYLRCMPRGRAPTTREDSLEWAMLLLLIALVTPISWNYGFVWMLYPLGVATKMMLDAPPLSRERLRTAGWLALSLLVQGTALPMRRGAQAYGCVFFSAVILLIGLGLALRRISTDEQDAGSPLPERS